MKRLTRSRRSIKHKLILQRAAFGRLHAMCKCGWTAKQAGMPSQVFIVYSEHAASPNSDGDGLLETLPTGILPSTVWLAIG